MNKKFLPLVALSMLSIGFIATSCDDDDEETTWERYTDWRNDNNAWIAEKAALLDANGNHVFTAYQPRYSATQFLMRFVNDTTETSGNLQPYFTSTATVNYSVYLYNGTRIDSAANYTSELSSSSLIGGWSEIITRMHVGDSVEAILPYVLGYGASGATSVYPYSALRFNIRLTDVPAYEVRP